MVEDGRDLVVRVWLLLFVHRFHCGHFVNQRLLNPPATEGCSEKAPGLRERGRLRRRSHTFRQSCRFEGLQVIDGDVPHTSYVLRFREPPQPRQRPPVLPERARIKILRRFALGTRLL